MKKLLAAWKAAIMQRQLRLVTIARAGELLGMNMPLILRLIKDGSIESVYWNRAQHIPVASLVNFARSHSLSNDLNIISNCNGRR